MEGRALLHLAFSHKTPPIPLSYLPAPASLRSTVLRAVYNCSTDITTRSAVLTRAAILPEGERKREMEKRLRKEIRGLKEQVLPRSYASVRRVVAV